MRHSVNVQVPMGGKVCIVTGATSGVGKETAREFARLGATVVLACRNVEKGETVLAEFEEETHNPRIEVLHLDLERHASVRDFVRTFDERHDRLHVLVNNAGVYENKRRLTPDSLEATFGVNHLSHFLLTNLLLPHLRKSAPSRIVNVASEAHRSARLRFDDLMGEKRYFGWRAYSQSKLANVLFTYELARRLAGSGVTANAAHPGLVATGFARGRGVVGALMRIGSPLMLTSAEGAENVVQVTSAPDLERVSGKYFVRSKPVRSTRASYDEEAARRLWETSERLCGLAPSRQGIAEKR